jgi:hypothetical protein
MNKECIKKLEEAIEALSKYIEQQDNRIKVPKQPEPQKKRKIVFDYLVNLVGETPTPTLKPRDFKTIKELSKMGNKAFLFSAQHAQMQEPFIYIGHYE